MRDRVQSTVDFVHNGEQITGTLFTYYYDNIEKFHTFMFNYKGNNIHISLKEDEDYWSVAPLHCKVIDKCGMDIYQKYDKYLTSIKEFNDNYIVLNDKVYKYFCEQVSNSPRYYILRLKMADGTMLDGTYRFTDIKEKGNKKKLFENLQYQVKNHFKQTNVEPDVSQLMEEETQQYQETKKLIKEIHESL